MIIKVSEAELRQLLKDYLGIKTVPRKLLKRFKGYLDIDVMQWLRDNAKAFNRMLAEEKYANDH